MVPQKVTLENFLSYREKQELEFADFDLCMLSGPNGSGKSSVFDAVTFALFGEHRAGASSFDDLINKQADAAAVEFEFLLDGRRWQARRTIRRKRTGGATCTMQLNQWSGQRGGWEAVPETSTQRGFNSWVRHHVGLTIETFTSSMLLRQGESDRLISAKAPERFKVLAGIVELERYQKLEERANDQRKKASARCDALDGQLRVVAAVTDHELRLAAEQAVTATQTVALADQGIVEFQSLLMHAGQWEQIGAALHAARTQHDGYKRLLEQAEKIKLEFLRLSDLRQTLPHLRAIADQCRKLAESQAAAKAIGAERAATQEALEHLTQQEADARAALEKLQADIADAETKRHAGSELLAMLKTSLTIAETFAHQRAALAGAEAELAKLPGDPSGDLAAARARRDDANSVRLALPILVRFDEHRRELIRLRGTLPELTQARQATLDKLEAHGAGEDALQRQLKSAAAAVERAQKDDSDAAAHVKVAREALRKISDLGPDAAGTGCPTCGQPLTSDHLAAERQRRQEELDRLTTSRAEAAKIKQASDDAHKQLSQRLNEANQQRAALEQLLQAANAQVESVNRDLRKESPSCRREYDALAAEMRDRMALPAGATDDWAATTWPNADDLQTLRHQATAFADAQDRVAVAETVHARWQQFAAAADAARAALANQPSDAVASDVEQLRARHASLAQELQAVADGIKARQSTLKSGQTVREKLAKDVAATSGAIAALDQKRAVEQNRQENAADAVRQSAAHLTGDWPARADAMTAAQLQSWGDEADALDRAGTREAHEKLHDAVSSARAVEARIADLDGQLAQVPEPARVPSASVEQQLRAAIAEREQHEKSRQATEATRAQLEDRRRRRQALETEALDADRRHAHLKVLAELLGRKRLQLHLVRQAERRIVECANSILDRISGGDLRVQLRGLPAAGETGCGTSDDATDQALELECVNRVTAGQKPINVVFLSGSQRFRVAVSLALAIGQYASGRRSGECVVIDEGFGSLDSQGQDVMIQELQRLKGIMERIILVSHQESFAAAFPTGFRFTLENGETRVSRISA